MEVCLLRADVCLIPVLLRNFFDGGSLHHVATPLQAFLLLCLVVREGLVGVLEYHLLPWTRQRSQTRLLSIPAVLVSHLLDSLRVALMEAQHLSEQLGLLVPLLERFVYLLEECGLGERGLALILVALLRLNNVVIDMVPLLNMEYRRSCLTRTAWPSLWQTELAVFAQWQAKPHVTLSRQAARAGHPARQEGGVRCDHLPCTCTSITTTTCPRRDLLQEG